MDSNMNDSAEFFETIPWSIDSINDITGDNIVPNVIEENVETETCNDNEFVQPIALPTFSQEDLGFLEASFAITPEDALAAEKLLHLSEANRVPLTSVCVPSLDVDVAAVVNEAAAAVIESGQTDFDADEEQRKLLNLLQIPNQKVTVEPVIPHIDFRIVRCSNCLNAFDFEKFQFHVCDYDENQQLIVSPNALADAEKDNKIPCMEPIFPEEHAAVRLLRENQIRIRRFLKEELKYEAPTTSVKRTNSITITLDDTGKKCITSDFETSFQTDVTQITSSTPNSINTGKRPENPHECTICDRRFVHASGLLRHMEKHALDLIPTSSGRQTVVSQRTHGLRVVIKCQLCGRVFFKVKSAYTHLLAHFPYSPNEDIEMDNYMEVPYEAFVDEAIAFIQKEETSASNQFGSIYQVKGSNYLKVIVLGSVLQCEFCDYIFTDVSYLFLHSSVHSPERRFECLSCEIYVNTTKEIYSHFQAECVFMRENLKVIQANTQRYFVCNVCEKKFQTLEHLHEHRYTACHFFPRFNSKLQKLQVPCEYCESVFDNVQELVFHFEAQHFKKCRRDNVLGYGNNQSSSKLRQYLCDVCGKSYTQSSHLWQHLRFHQGVKPFACQEPGCSRKFTIRPDLHDHIRKCHTGERPFHCHICGKRFLTGSVFYQHRLIHRGERRYECNYCSKRFYRADALKNHTRIHTGEKPYDCEYCTKSFRQRGDCDKHTRARHAHLDESTRNMLKLQKLNLKLAAAAKKGLIDGQQQQQQQQQTVLSLNQEKK